MGLTKVSYAMINGAPINPLDYGAVGDGVTDDTAALLAALNAADGEVLDGASGTYKLTSAISPTCENVVITNMTIDCSTINDQYLINFTGTQGNAIDVTTNAVLGDYTIQLADTSSLAAEDYIYIDSNTVWDSTTGTTLGQICKIKTVDSSTQVTIYEALLYTFNTANNANVYLLTMKNNITFDNVKFIGANAYSQSALNFDKCSNVVVRDCEFEYFDYISCRVNRSVNFVGDSTSIKYARGTGLAYGFAILSGSNGVKIVNGYSEDTRHYVTVGGNTGVNSNIIVSNNVIKASKDAGVDCHPACNYMTVSNNQIESAAVVPASSVGITAQGLNVTITGNTIIGAQTYGIFVQNLVNIISGQYIISNNNLDNSGNSASTDIGIYVTNDSSAYIWGLTIANNTVSGVNEYHIYVNASAQTIGNVAITGNACYFEAAITSCYLRAESTNYLQDVTVSGNVFRAASATGQALYLAGATSGGVRRVAIGNNVLSGGDYGLRVLYGTQITATGNQFYNNATARYLIDDATCLQVYLDRLVDNWHSVTGSSYTVADDILNIVCSYAGTVTITLPDVDTWLGRSINIKTTTANTVVSASSNVVTLPNTTAGTAILAATDGAWVTLQSDGTNWVAMQGSL